MKKGPSSGNMVDINSIIEGTVKFRDGKKWKSRWCVMRKLSPVADCLHMQFYKDSKERFKSGPTKASLSLEHFLGIEIGFTLDKESNTIAVLCQDVTVILAFDTREVQMQWQVKISANLGDDIQYLVLVASAATKIKIPQGPARLHIQNHRFCITTGVPPRLAGLWTLTHLRRYGIVDNRFCFEGGSSSGKCEGFVVLITDYGDEIANCFKLASQGKLNSNSRFTKPLDSPRKIKDNQSVRCDCSSVSTIWPSQESRAIESFIGCDTSSFVDEIDSSDELNHFSRKRLTSMERCMRCSSKRSLIPTMSRSSTITEANQEACFGAPSYKFSSSVEGHNQKYIYNGCKSAALDRISMRSQESCGNFSEYSIPRQFYSHETASIRSFVFPRHESSRTNYVGSYENYDSPKILSPSNDNQIENYDKPKRILEQNAGGGHTVVIDGHNNNYDKPNIHCCINGLKTNNNSRLIGDDSKAGCACHRVMSWADNWMPCRRGSGIEKTEVPFNCACSTPTPKNSNSEVIIAQEPAKFKLNDFSNPNITNSAIDSKHELYAFVDPTKKISKRLNEEQSSNSISSKSIHTSLAESHTTLSNPNYANLDFEKSLNIYENARDVLKRVVYVKNLPSAEDHLKENKENENYLIMDVSEKTKNFPGYIAMHPINPQIKTNDQYQQKQQNQMKETTHTLPIISMHSLKKINEKLLLMGEKCNSNPNLSRPCVNEESSITKLLLRKSLSVNSLKYRESEPKTFVYDKSLINKVLLTSTYHDSTRIENSNIEKNMDSHEKIKAKIANYFECSKQQNQNRDSSSSNDSGVSTSSTTTIVPKQYIDEIPKVNHVKKRRQFNPTKACVHASLIRRSKSFDPFSDLSFQFRNVNKPNNDGQYKSEKFPSLGTIMANHIDSNSTTSSATSDMSDYIETLSLSSHSSSDVDALKNKHNIATIQQHSFNSTMRPRSGKEYEKIDRSAIVSGLEHRENYKPALQLTSTSASLSNQNYVNISLNSEYSKSSCADYHISSFQEEYVMIKD